MEKKNINVITGGASGIGFACAKALGKHGPVVISGRYEDRLVSACAELTALGIENYYFVADSADLEAVKALAEFAASKGNIKNLVNSAGISGDSPDASRRKVLEINAQGTVNAVKAFYPLLGQGSVQINIASMGRFTTVLWGMDKIDFTETFQKWDSPELVDAILEYIPDTEKGPDLAYTLSKVFVSWFSGANTRRYASRGARILTVSPGHYNTRMMKDIAESKPEIAAGMKQANPMGRWGDPDEIGTLVEYLCSDAASYINGTDILTDGGFSTANIVMGANQIAD